MCSVAYMLITLYKICECPCSLGQPLENGSACVWEHLADLHRNARSLSAYSIPKYATFRIFHIRGSSGCARAQMHAVAWSVRQHISRPISPATARRRSRSLAGAALPNLAETGTDRCSRTQHAAASDTGLPCTVSSKLFGARAP